MLVLNLGKLSIDTTKSMVTENQSEASPLSIARQCYTTFHIRNSGISANWIRAPPTGHAFVMPYSQYMGESTMFLLPLPLSVEISQAKTSRMSSLPQMRIHVRIGTIHTILSTQKFQTLMKFVKEVPKQLQGNLNASNTVEEPSEIPLDSVNNEPTSVSPISTVRVQNLALRLQIEKLRITMGESAKDNSTVNLRHESMTWRGVNYGELMGKYCRPLLSFSLKDLSILLDTNSDGIELQCSSRYIHSWDLLRLYRSGWSSYTTHIKDKQQNVSLSKSNRINKTPVPIHPLHYCQILTAGTSALSSNDSNNNNTKALIVNLRMYSSSKYSTADTAVDIYLAPLACVVNRDTIVAISKIVMENQPVVDTVVPNISEDKDTNNQPSTTSSDTTSSNGNKALDPSLVADYQKYEAVYPSNVLRDIRAGAITDTPTDNSNESNKKSIEDELAFIYQRAVVRKSLQCCIQLHQFTLVLNQEINPLPTESYIQQTVEQRNKQFQTATEEASKTSLFHSDLTFSNMSSLPLKF